eukprot:TRINITY_DN1118_c0_g1_i1.p1 TRINITY_DN1118_c0_g1~~TRINITY_DN1118_c0_g1_i1.p1  ORF type:complete len:178 (-),score=29.21 TRINITY_DN1118_c0_g1_i1:141-674(-)
MLKSKRTYDVFTNHERAPQCSPHRIQFLDPDDGNVVAKRARLSRGVESSPMDKEGPASQNSENEFHSHLTSKRSRALSFSQNATTSPSSSAAPLGHRSASGARLYTQEEVVALIQKALAEREAAITKAVEEREASLRAEFSQVLETRLEEQYRQFAKYSEDCISRQMKDKQEPSYIA